LLSYYRLSKKPLLFKSAIDHDKFHKLLCSKFPNDVKDAIPIEIYYDLEKTSNQNVINNANYLTYCVFKS